MKILDSNVCFLSLIWCAHIVRQNIESEWNTHKQYNICAVSTYINSKNASFWKFVIIVTIHEFQDVVVKCKQTAQFNFTVKFKLINFVELEEW